VARLEEVFLQVEDRDQRHHWNPQHAVQARLRRFRERAQFGEAVVL
jgi:hypothetical protein